MVEGAREGWDRRLGLGSRPSPPLESPSTASGPEAALPEPGVPEAPNLGPATVVAGGAAAAAAASVTWALTFSEVLGKREENIIKYGNPYGPPSQYAHASGYTGGPSEDQSDVQKGWILYDGERRGQDGTIYTKDGQIAVHANGTSALTVEERQAIAASNRRAAGQWQAVKESMSDSAQAYQYQVTGQAGMAYVVNGVKFDGVNAEGLIEAKGPGYSNFLDQNGRWKRWFTGAEDMLMQASEQVAAAGGRPVIWYVAEPDAAAAIQKLVGDIGIKVVYMPPTQ